ncbi:MAG: glycosyltransferase family 2 protein [Planctomycetota bacterium]|jgi:glycosyltransferase involved in cell wall biosynthesis
MEPRVVVVVPCYRQAQFLAESVGSVAAQTYQNLECVIVDDGSPDNTAEVAEQLIAQYPERDIRLLRQENAGLSGARNAGIHSSEAPLILPLDADDRLDPTAIEKMVAPFVEDPSLAVVCPTTRQFGAGDKMIVPYQRDLTWLLKRNTYIGTSLFSREAWKAAGGYKPNMEGGYEDWEFWISIIESGGTVHVLPEVLFYYRQTGRSMHDGALAKDLWLRAQIVLNHPEQFERGRIWLARRTRRVKDPTRPGLLNRLLWLCFFVRDRNRTAFKQHLAAMFSL